MTIIITSAQVQLIYDHAENIYPEECCGILLGKIAGVSKILIEVIPTINEWIATEIHEIHRTKHSRYSIPPRAIFQAQKRARDLQLEIIGFFHSHPDYPAIPSACDRDQAWEVYSYPIVSVLQGKVTDIQSWVLDSNLQFHPEPIQLLPSEELDI